MATKSIRNNKERDAFTNKIALRLKEARDTKKMSQEELAHRAGLSNAYLGHLERGVYSPTLYVIWRISKGLNMKLDQLLKDFS